MNTIKRVSLSQQVFTSIVEYTQEHGLQVGDQLPTEGEFCELFEVSRTSIREAMKALSMSGAVQSIPGKGTFIRPPMLNFILNNSENLAFQAKVSISQVMEVRTAVEILAGDLAIKKATKEDIISVEEAMEELRVAVSSHEPWGVQGAKFHVRIAESSKNPLVIKLVETYTCTIGRYRDAMVDSNSESDMAYHIQQHEMILNALRERDNEKLRAAITEHMKDTEENLKRLVNQNSAIYFISK